jgi:serine/threonine protein kinase
MSVFIVEDYTVYTAQLDYRLYFDSYPLAQMSQVQIGAGGMGEVYRARDTRLDRTVGIKVLPSDISSNADLRTRFEREAKAISALQHPQNLFALHRLSSVAGGKVSPGTVERCARAGQAR